MCSKIIVWFILLVSLIDCQNAIEVIELQPLETYSFNIDSIQNGAILLTAPQSIDMKFSCCISIIWPVKYIFEMFGLDKCKLGSVLVSTSGNTNFTDANKFCGDENFQGCSTSNKLALKISKPKWFMSIFFRYYKCTAKAGGSTTTTPTNSTSVSNCSCGKTLNSSLSEYPYFAVVLFYDNPYCDAAIISSSFVLTSVRCINIAYSRQTTIFVGDLKEIRSANLVYGQLFEAQLYIPGPEGIDVGLIKTATEIIFNEAVQPICLPFLLSNMTFENENVTAINFFDNKMYATDYQILTNDICSATAAEKKYPFNSSVELCVEEFSCLPFGAPALYMSNNIAYDVGVITSTYSEDNICYGNVLKRVTAILNWIENETNSTEFCKV
uniref:Putative trypsin n=1 Tax=Corethrella appendiculata TaxID=1370023 RepID=U5EVD3_9DIPT